MRGSEVVERSYEILIHTDYLSNPFCVAAILSHELCHVLYVERLCPGVFRSYDPNVMHRCHGRSN
jgi:hypothetical protein